MQLTAPHITFFNVYIRFKAKKRPEYVTVNNFLATFQSNVSGIDNKTFDKVL
jgi:hypothetical protein